MKINIALCLLLANSFIQIKGEFRRTEWIINANNYANEIINRIMKNDRGNDRICSELGVREINYAKIGLIDGFSKCDTHQWNHAGYTEFQTRQCYFKVEKDFHQFVENAEKSAIECVITECNNMSNLAMKDNYLCVDSVVHKKLPRCFFTKTAKIALLHLNNTLSYKNFSSSLCVAERIEEMNEKFKIFWLDVRGCEEKYSIFLNNSVISGTCLSQHEIWEGDTEMNTCCKNPLETFLDSIDYSAMMIDACTDVDVKQKKSIP